MQKKFQNPICDTRPVTDLSNINFLSQIYYRLFFEFLMPQIVCNG